MFADLERRYPGIRFRMIDEQDMIRGHIRVFVNGDAVRAMDTPLRATDKVMIVQALSFEHLHVVAGARELTWMSFAAGSSMYSDTTAQQLALQRRQAVGPARAAGGPSVRAPG